MRVFVTGATGFIGSAIVRQLIDSGRQAVGLARSDASAKSLTAAGAIPHRGSLEDLDSLRRGAAAADGVIHTAFFQRSVTPARLCVCASCGGRGLNETAALAMAARGVRVSVVRLPPVVHGPGDRTGFVPPMVGVARKNRASLHAGDGLNRWGAVHRLDAARLFVLALEHGEAGGIYPAVAEEGSPVLDIATAIGQRLDLKAADLIRHDRDSRR